jgi:hypothetical protein
VIKWRIGWRKAASNGQAGTSTISYYEELTTSLRRQGLGCPSQLRSGLYRPDTESRWCYGASKLKFKSETRHKKGIESLHERERHTKGFKALDDCDISLDGIVINRHCQTLRQEINHKGQGGRREGSKVMGVSAPLFNNTKWDVGEGKADTPRDSSHCQKELLSCGMAREDVTVLVIRLS